MATSSESRLAASANGDLVDRVQQLRLDNQLGAGTGRSMSGSSWLPWILCGMLAVTWAGVGVRWYKSAPPKEEPTGPAPASSGSAPGVGPAPEAGALVTQLKGIVIPSLQVTVSPRDVAAEITDIFFAEGKRVKAGDKLATLLDHQYVNRLNTDEAAVTSAAAQRTRATAAKTAAEAMVAKSDAVLAAAKSRVTRAIAFQDRAKNDFEEAERQNMAGTIATLEYRRIKADKLAADADLIAADADVKAAERSVEAAKADVNTATSNVAAAVADLRAAESRRDEAKRLVGNCVVTAPLDGTILTKSADKGALVSPMSFNVAAGICSIADLSKLEVEIEVPERLVTKIKPGQVCRLQADADPNRAYRGVVDRVMPIADDTKNVVKVRIRAYLPKAEEPGAFLKPKMGITTTVHESPFQLDREKDFLWGDEDERKAAWEKEWKK